MEQVTWAECVAFASDVNAGAPGLGAALPTEAQWEYACRAGNQSAFNDGSVCTKPDGEDPALDGLGWFGESSKGKTHPLKQKLSNGWGLYDLHGNVWEWCRDWWKRDAYAARAEGVTDRCWSPTTWRPAASSAAAPGASGRATAARPFAATGTPATACATSVSGWPQVRSSGRRSRNQRSMGTGPSWCRRLASHKRRTRFARVLANEPSLLRRVSALLTEISQDCETGGSIFEPVPLTHRLPSDRTTIPWEPATRPSAPAHPSARRFRAGIWF